MNELIEVVGLAMPEFKLLLVLLLQYLRSLGLTVQHLIAHRALLSIKVVQIVT
jgi:hypothetical protein